MTKTESVLIIAGLIGYVLILIWTVALVPAPHSFVMILLECVLGLLVVRWHVR